ncbi:MAG: DinB family protein [Bacteroidia bacterium]|nr:DinB family protein [Bacteroidia bacterium]
MESGIRFALGALRTTRSRVLEVLSSVPEESLTQIPTGFNNHLLWNAGHLLVSQHLLTYGLAGIPISLPQNLVDGYRRGSHALEGPPGDALRLITRGLLESPDQLKADYKEGVFAEFEPYTTSFGVKITNIREAIMFNNLHEGIHFGYMLAQKRALGV